MSIILYVYIFIIGITFGSFFTLAVYRIPEGKPITHERSFCPKCKHKLSFLDMIPLFSYIFLRGKCRYCKEKIRPRYFLLELFSGIAFVLFALSIKLNIYNLDVSNVTYFIFGLLYIAGLFIISGIDKEKKQIQHGVILYLVIVEVLYITYLYIIEHASIYRYIIYFLALAILSAIDTIYYRKKLKNNYTVENLILLVIMIVFTYETCTILTVICTLLAVTIMLIINKIKSINKKCVSKTENTKIPIGFFLGVSNIIMLIFTNFLIFYR